MTADEIRKQWNVIGKFPPELLPDFMLVEIAAQLAELNETLRSVIGQAGPTQDGIAVFDLGMR